MNTIATTHASAIPCSSFDSSLAKMDIREGGRRGLGMRTPHDIATRETEDQSTAPDTIFPT